jgi:drug/metabolite transporter (DMT)-like permease
MNLEMIISSALIALAFVTWPIVGKYSGADSGWVGTLASLGTLLVVAVSSRRMLAVPPRGRIILILLVAGIINGIGVYFYSMKTSDPQIQTAIFMVLTAIMMVIVIPIMDWALNGTSFNIYQVAAFGTAALTIYLFFLGR